MTGTETICDGRFTVRNGIPNGLRFQVRDTDTILNNTMNCMQNRITNIKTDLDDDAVSKGYVDNAVSSVTTDVASLETKTQNFTANGTINTIEKVLNLDCQT